MKRSLQEIVELVVFGLIALLVGTGVLWLLGWLIGLVGSLFMWLAGILWLLLRWIIPVVVIIAAVYALFRLLQRQNKKRAEGSTSGEGPTSGEGSKSGSVAVVSSPRASGGVIGTTVVDAPPGSSASDNASRADTFPSSAVAGRPADYVPPPAAAPVTTPPPVSASGEPVSPLSAAPEVEPLADEPVMASGEPVPSGETPTADETVDTKVVEASAEPVEVEVVDAEAVEPEGDASKNKKK